MAALAVLVSVIVGVLHSNANAAQAGGLGGVVYVYRSYVVNNGSDGMATHYSFRLNGGLLYLYVFYKNISNHTIVLGPSEVINGSIITICLMTPFRYIVLASGYYNPSNIDEAFHHAMDLVTYLPLPVSCLALIYPGRHTIPPGGEAYYVVPMMGLFGPGTNGIEYWYIVPIPPGKYTFILNAFNQTLIVDFTLRRYVGSIVYIANGSIYATIPVEPRAIRAVLNIVNISSFKTVVHRVLAYYCPVLVGNGYNGILMIRNVSYTNVLEGYYGELPPTKYIYQVYYEALINGTWVTIVVAKSYSIGSNGKPVIWAIGPTGELWWPSLATTNVHENLTYSAIYEPCSNSTLT